MEGRKESASGRGEGRKFLYQESSWHRLETKMFAATSGHRDTHLRKVHASLFTTLICAINFAICSYLLVFLILSNNFPAFFFYNESYGEIFFPSKLCVSG